MSLEERFLKAIDEEGDPLEVAAISHSETRHQRLQRKNKAVIDRFLGSGQRINAVGILPRYYGELLTWALERHIEQEQWKVIQTLGYCGSEPVYLDVSTDYDQKVNLLMNGQLLVEKGNSHLIVTVDINPSWRGSVTVEGSAKKKQEIDRFVEGVVSITREQNFYRGKRIEFARRIRFLDTGMKSWDSIILDTGLKTEIRANTIGFLKRKELWAEYGIPPQRGILLAGEPGTGKTMICKALMAEADGITRIITSAYALGADEYITELYQLAQDLSPCIVFIEDIDLIGQSREEFGYQKGPALASLLAVLDGIEEKKEIVTVATTNCLDILDKALSERPSRFDRVIRLSRPLLAERKELLSLLCLKIPLDECVQDYIARRAEGCTPAQLQEIIYSLVIEHSEEIPNSTNPNFSKDDFDRAVSRINGRNGHRLGFNTVDNHNGNRSNLASTMRPG